MNRPSVPPLHIAIMRGEATNKQIAERFALTTRYVAATRRALGAPNVGKATTYDGRRVRSDQARALLEAGHSVEHVSEALKVSPDYVRQLRRTAMPQSAKASEDREQPGRCERHAQACRDAGGFWSLSERFLGMDPRGRRRMAVGLPLRPPVYGAVSS